MRSRSTLAIGLSGRRFRAVEVSRARNGLRVRSVLHSVVPDAVDIMDFKAVGQWIGDELASNNLNHGRTTFAIPRERVSLKRLTLPTIDKYELPDMVRLSMSRELPFDPDDAVIDFDVIDQRDGKSTVLVAAIQQQSVDQAREIARAAKLKIESLSLRCVGVASLLRTMDAVSDESNAFLGIDITADGVEIAVLTNGNIRFSRAAKLAADDDVDTFANSVVTEVRRSWMSYRIVEDAPEITRVFLIGDDEVTTRVAGPVSDLMKLRTEVIDRHPRIDRGEHAMRSGWPLAGLLLEGDSEVERIDFANPTRPPDRNARKRILALAAAGLLLFIGVFLGLLGYLDLQELRKQRQDYVSQVNEDRQVFHEYERDVYLLRHLEAWAEVRVDWVGHIAYLGRQLPDNERVLLDQIQGSLRFNGVDYNSRDQAWQNPYEIVLTLDGEAKEKLILDDVRRTFAENVLYRLNSSGPDQESGQRYPFPFKLTLRTDASSPPSADGGATVADTDEASGVSDAQQVSIAKKGGDE